MPSPYAIWPTCAYYFYMDNIPSIVLEKILSHLVGKYVWMCVIGGVDGGDM